MRMANSQWKMQIENWKGSAGIALDTLQFSICIGHWIIILIEIGYHSLVHCSGV